MTYFLYCLLQRALDDYRYIFQGLLHDDYFYNHIYDIVFNPVRMYHPSCI